MLMVLEFEDLKIVIVYSILSTQIPHFMFFQVMKSNEIFENIFGMLLRVAKLNQLIYLKIVTSFLELEA